MLPDTLLNFMSIFRTLRNKEATVALSLDVKKAFDTFWVVKLLYKLIKFDLPPRLLKFLHSNLTERRFCVSVSGVVSEGMDAFQGVP